MQKVLCIVFLVCLLSLTPTLLLERGSAKLGTLKRPVISFKEDFILFELNIEIEKKSVKKEGKDLSWGSANVARKKY